jgi:PAS domain S-box-containing protein
MRTGLRAQMADLASEGRGAEAALRESREQLRLIIENARNQAIFILDPDGLVVEWRASAEAVFGYAPAEIIGQSVDILFVPEDRAAGAPELERALAKADGKAPDVRWHLRSDGARVFIDGVVTALRDEAGGLTGFLKIGEDATARHAAGQRQQMLMEELQHRVRNTLAVVRSIVRRTAENSESVEDMSAHLQGRIDAFARVQAVVTRDLDKGVSLDALIADEFLAHATGEGERLTIEGPELELPAKAAEALSLAVHELTTNAVKYGALSIGTGVIRIRWARVAGGNGERLHFTWEERGRGRALIAVEHAGFGFEFLQRTLPYELDAETEVEFLGEGLRFTLLMPLPASAAARPAQPGETGAQPAPPLSRTGSG